MQWILKYFEIAYKILLHVLYRNIFLYIQSIVLSKTELIGPASSIKKPSQCFTAIHTNL